MFTISLLTLIISSCNKKDDNNQCLKNENYLEAEFEGASIEPQYIAGGGIGGYTFYVERNEENSSDWNITVLSKNNVSFYLSIINLQAVGSYDLETGTEEEDYPPLPPLYNKTRIVLDQNLGFPPSYYFSLENSGTVEITGYNNEDGILVGTFNCNLYSSVDPTIIVPINGKFNINLSTLDIDKRPCWL